MNTKTNKQQIPDWFKGTIYDKGDIVSNRFSGEEYELNNVELSMYDFVMGASLILEMSGPLNNNKSKQIIIDLRKGLDWFRKYNLEAYMVLLD